MPRHIRNILIAVTLVILALVAGINGYIHHQVKTNIDNGLDAIQPLMQVRYSSLSTSLITGEIQLDNVRIQSAVLPDAVRLGNITIETPGFFYMLNASSNINKGVMPKHFGFRIDDFYFDLNSENAKLLDRMVERLQPLYARGRTLCGGKAIFGPADYRNMGYKVFHTQLRMAYRYDSAKKALTLGFDTNIKRAGQLSATAVIKNLGSMETANMMQEGMPKLASASLSYKDQGYTQQMVKYCSELGNMKKQLFIDTEINQPDDYFFRLWGFAPGTGLRDAYKDFLIKSDSIVLNINPADDFNPMMAGHMSQEELFNKLNVSLLVNDVAVEDLNLKLPPAEFTEQFERELNNRLDIKAIINNEPAKPVEPAQPAEPKKAKPAFHKISLVMAPYHIDDYVRVTTTDGHLRKGQLIRIDQAYLYVQRKVAGGKFTVSIRKDKVKTIEAYYSK